MGRQRVSRAIAQRQTPSAPRLHGRNRGGTYKRGVSCCLTTRGCATPTLRRFAPPSARHNANARHLSPEGSHGAELLATRHLASDSGIDALDSPDRLGLAVPLLLGPISNRDGFGGFL